MGFYVQIPITIQPDQKQVSLLVYCHTEGGNRHKRKDLSVVCQRGALFSHLHGQR